MFYNSKFITVALSALGLIVTLIQPAERAIAQMKDQIFDAATFGKTTETAATTQPSIDKAFVENWSDMVTGWDEIIPGIGEETRGLDIGFNDFSGNSGTINSGNNKYIACQVLRSDSKSEGLHCNWNFSGDTGAYTGLFFCVFGLCETKARFGDSPAESDAVTLKFPEHTLNLNQIDGIITEPSGSRLFNRLNILVDYNAPSPVWMRIELKDPSEAGRYAHFKLQPRFRLQQSSNPANVISWDFRKFYKKTGSKDLNLSRVKTVSLVIERENVGDRINNPSEGNFNLKQIWFTPNRAEVKPAQESDYLDLVERRVFQYFIDWSSRKDASYGIPQDRSSFGDLLTVGGIGFALPAYIIGADRGWIKREDARRRTLAVLRTLSNESAFGAESIGRIGHKGWFYHFLGVNGRRKLNFDFQTTAIDESMNTVELSTIDTGLALMGVLAAQSYFNGNSADEQEIRRLAQQIYDTVDWPFMLETNLQQFYLGWKPREERDPKPPFDIPDSEGEGHYSGTLEDPATLDSYTDEALLVILLATGSTTHPLLFPKTTYCSLMSSSDQDGLIRTYPGALFTYQFFQAFLDSRPANGKPPHFPRCMDEQQAVDWFANSKQAIMRTRDYAVDNPLVFKTYDPGAWGLSAAEGPHDLYAAYGAPPVAVNPKPDQDGTITYYSMGSALGFAMKTEIIEDDSLYPAILEGLNAAWSRGHWHYRFGLPDAFNDDISSAVKFAKERQIEVPWLREQGEWVQRALFAIDQGPLLLHLENARSGRIWELLAANENIKRAIAKLQENLEQVRLDGESGQGDGIIRWRSNASGLKAVWLHQGEMRTWPLLFDGQGEYAVTLRYSNDGPTDTVAVFLDNNQVGQCNTVSTGSGGGGWNQFAECAIGNITLSPGSYTVVVKADAADSYGVEIDYVDFILVR